MSLTSSEKRFAFRAAASVGSGSASFDLSYDPTGPLWTGDTDRLGQPRADGRSLVLLGFDLGLARCGRRHRPASCVAAAAHARRAEQRQRLDRVHGRQRHLAGRRLASWPAETQRAAGRGDGGVPFNCLAGRFEVSGGVATLRRLVFDTPRATLVGGGYVSLRNEGWEFILAPEARDYQSAPLASPFRLKGGTGRPTVGALDPGLTRLIVPGGSVASLVAQINLAARQAGANACAVVAPRVDGMRPGLRAQMPTPSAADRASARPGPRRRPRRKSPGSSAEIIHVPKKAAAAVPEDCRRPRPSAQPAKLRPKTKPAIGLELDRKREHGRAVSLAASGRHREATSRCPVQRFYRRCGQSALVVAMHTPRSGAPVMGLLPDFPSRLPRMTPWSLWGLAGRLSPRVAIEFRRSRSLQRVDCGDSGGDFRRRVAITRSGATTPLVSRMLP